MNQWLERHLQTLVGLARAALAAAVRDAADGRRDRHRARAAGLPARAGAERARRERRLEQRARHLRVHEAGGERSTTRSARAERIRKRRDVDEVTLIAADDALAEFRSDSGFGEALEALKDNPLPHALVVRPDAECREPGRVAGAHRRAARDRPAWTSCSSTPSGSAASTRSSTSCGAVVFLAAGLLALGVLVIVGNTIRLDIENRRDEIEVTKLVGGSDALRAPAVPLHRRLVRARRRPRRLADRRRRGRACSSDPVQRIAGLYGSSFALQGLGLAGWAALLARRRRVLGWLGSFIAADAGEPARASSRDVVS